MATQSPAYDGDYGYNGSDGDAPLEEWYAATQSPGYDGDYGHDGGDAPHGGHMATQSPAYDGDYGYDGGDAPHDEDYSVTHGSVADSGDDGVAAAATDGRTS